MTSPSPAASRWIELLFAGLTRSAGLLVAMFVLGMIAVLVAQSWPAFRDTATNGLLTSSDWIPSPPSGPPLYGALAFVWGTFITAALAMMMAVPLGVATAAFLVEIAPGWVRRTGMFFIELLAAIPSVVFGFWGRYFLAPVVQKGFDTLGPTYLIAANGVRQLCGLELLPPEPPNTGGSGVLSAAITLAVMVLPYITAISFDVIQAVPRTAREGAFALGASRWQTIWGVVLPTARPGIIAAAFLALGRALGETMAVTMLIGNQPVISLSPFAYGNTIASKIALSVGEANEPSNRSALIALAVILFLMTALFNLLARAVLNYVARPRKPASGNTPTVASTAQESTEMPAPVPPPQIGKSKAAFWNRVMTALLAISFVVTIVPLFLILGLITYRGAKVIDWNLFQERERSTLSDDQYEQYKAWKRGEATRPTDDFGDPIERGGLGHAMLGSLILVSGATIFAVPIGLLAAVWLAEARGSQTANIVRFLIEQLGGVPSIVIGLFIYAILVAPSYTFLRGADARPLNTTAWAGIVALMLIMIPVIIRSAEESMKLVPNSLRQASYALGATRMQTTMRVILPAALPAIVTGIFLAVGRIAGETAPLIFTAGQTKFWPAGLTHDTPFLTGYIFRYSLSSYADEQDQGWAAALVLLSVVMLLNVSIRLLAGKRVITAAKAE
jgi:phosphate transport system permease protein